MPELYTIRLMRHNQNEHTKITVQHKKFSCTKTHALMHSESLTIRSKIYGSHLHARTPTLDTTTTPFAHKLTCTYRHKYSSTHNKFIKKNKSAQLQKMSITTLAHKQSYIIS